MTQYYPPTYIANSFNCPSCGVFSRQYWFDVTFVSGNMRRNVPHFDIAVCEHCQGTSYWYKEGMLIPDVGNVPLPNPDLPSEVIEDYNEARSILSRSPRGSAALLRLAIQKLCVHLGGQGKNINDDISKLVQVGLPSKVQQSLDIVRVIGNNAVHPGQLDITDNQELAQSLFGLINLIADVMITQPKHINSLYGQLPANLVEAIEKRDKK